MDTKEYKFDVAFSFLKQDETIAFDLIAQKAHKEGTSLKKMAVKLGYVTPEQFDEWVKQENIVGKIK